jgi:peptidoglycan hydrolase-like protein with peptidoglycan-binding domain
VVATCQNGWPAITSAAGVGRYTIPGTSYAVTCRPGDSSVILLDWLGFLHAEVEPLLVPGVWGWAIRNVRGSDDDLSNHAGGDAVDASAPRHPLATGLETWKPHPQSVQRIRRRIAAYNSVAPGVFRWGGDYSGRLDTMHGELLGTVATRKLLADAIRQGRLPGERSYLVGQAPTGGTVPAPAKPAAATGAAALPTLRAGQNSAAVRRLGEFLVSHFPAYAKFTPNGQYGPATTAAVREFQRRSGITGSDADGTIVGPRTHAALWQYGWRG